MLGLQYTTRFMEHWKNHRPKNYRQMRKDGTLNEFIQTHSKEAAEQVANLMQHGFQQHEAEEMVMPDFLWTGSEDR